jgi:hypothetical protein
MATPTYAQVIDLINQYIITNGNNEITANILNPVLQFITDFANNTIGDLEDLTTDEQDNIVNAINSIKQNFDDLVNKGIQLHTGINNPNEVSPSSYNYADFYMQIDIDNYPVQLWQWDGFTWIKSLSAVEGFPKLQITATAGQTVFPLGTTLLATAVFWNGVLLNDDDWSQLGSDITTTFGLELGDLFKAI